MQEGRAGAVRVRGESALPARPESTPRPPPTRGSAADARRTAAACNLRGSCGWVERTKPSRVRELSVWFVPLRPTSLTYPRKWVA